MSSHKSAHASTAGAPPRHAEPTWLIARSAPTRRRKLQGQAICNMHSHCFNPSMRDPLSLESTSHRGCALRPDRQAHRDPRIPVWYGLWPVARTEHASSPSERVMTCSGGRRATRPPHSGEGGPRRRWWWGAADHDAFNQPFNHPGRPSAKLNPRAAVARASLTARMRQEADNQRHLARAADDERGSLLPSPVDRAEPEPRHAHVRLRQHVVLDTIAAVVQAG